MIDHTEDLELVARALGGRYRAAPYVLNVPGSSLACKVDAFYYLAIEPMWIKYLSQWAGLSPARVEQALLRTGNMLAGPGKSSHYRQIGVVEPDSDQVRPLGASFVLASFVDRALALYGGCARPLPLSGLRLAKAERDGLAAFFEGRSPLQDLAFAAI